MNLILFLGSGVSTESGFPTGVGLTKMILESKELFCETNFLRALKEYDEIARKVGGTFNTKSKKTVGEIYRNGTSYEDLYYLCDEIAKFDWGLHNNSIIPAFMEILIEEFDYLLKQETTREKKLLEIGKFAHAAKRYINKVILETLSLVKEDIKGLDLIVKLAESPEVTSLNIVTLNHDLLVETLLAQKGISFIDGFGEWDGDVRWYEPDKYLSNAKVKILKLHGSIGWYPFAINGEEKMGKINGNETTHKKNADGNILECANKFPYVLTGLNKINYYSLGIYTDIHYHFQKILYENNIMIMSGYGWGDDSISARIMTWLDRKKENKLILLHHEEKIEELKENSLILDRDFPNWTDQKKLIPISKWLSEIDLEELLSNCK